MKILSTLVLSALCVQTCMSYHVLVYHTWGTKSHILQIAPIVEELLARGHEVTTCFFHPLKLNHENHTEIIVPNAIEGMSKEMSKLLLEEGHSVWNLKIIKFAVQALGDVMEDIALTPIKVNEIDSLMKSGKKVDLLVTMFSMPAFLADHFDCPIAFYLPVGPATVALRGTGNVDNLSIKPIITAPHIEPMDFSTRVLNHVQEYLTELWMAWIYNKVTDILRDNLGPQIRHPDEILRDRFSILIGGHHPVTHGSWPNLPNMIQVGAAHLKDPEPLPDNLKRFMDSASNGAVFVSFGSAVIPSQMPKEKLEMLVEAFKNLKMSVLWKWDSEVPNLPKNVKTSSWVPQQDILGHHNLKVFVTHGGLGSLQEAIYHKAVIIGIPFSNDQTPNILRAARHGYAKILHWDNITSADLTNAINDAMYDENMKLSLEEIHNLYTDTQQKPREKAAWWVEYVCRHKGAKILQSHHLEEAPWYQYHHVDIIIFSMTVIIAIIGILILICKICCRICCTRKHKLHQLKTE